MKLNTFCNIANALVWVVFTTFMLVGGVQSIPAFIACALTLSGFNYMLMDINYHGDPAGTEEENA